MPRFFIFLLLAFGTGGPAPAPALADDAPIPAADAVTGEDHDEALQLVYEGKIIPLEKVVVALKKQFDGEFLDARLHELMPGEPVYRVIWLTPDDRKLVIWVDALTGEVLKVEGARAE